MPETERVANPYRPGFNQPPLVFAGREDVLDGANEALEIAAYDARTPRPLILVGPRGVGKTVTLGEIADLAASKLAWPTVHLEAKAQGLLAELSLRLQHVRQLLEGDAGRDKPVRRRRVRVSRGTVGARVLGIGGSVELKPVDGDAQVDVVTALKDAMQSAVNHQAGLLLTLDELQNAAPAELNILGGMLQENVPKDWPLVVVVAALPSLRSHRGARKLPTYLERAEWHELQSLPLIDAHQALTEPARQAGRPMTAEAARLLLDLVGGYPYAIQVAGHFAWRESHNSNHITKIHAQQAAPRIATDLRQLFVSRWADASPREREYLRAIAEAERTQSNPPTGGQVAALLNQNAKAVSYLRDRLLKKGTIYQDGTGGLHFITPGMGAWILDRPDGA